MQINLSDLEDVVRLLLGIGISAFMGYLIIRGEQHRKDRGL